MRRIVEADAYGDGSVLSTVEVDSVDPGPGDVLVSVRAIGVNAWDVKRQKGIVSSDPSDLPLHFGSEGAGVVLGVGEGVESFVPSDEVLIHSANGTYTDEIVVKESSLIAKPLRMSWEQAGGLLLVGSTAFHCVEAAKVGNGDTLLVHAAAGGVGQMVVQLAVLRGVRVIGTAGEKQHEFLRSLGAEPVVYGDGLADRVRELAPDGVTAAIDCVGTDEAIDVSLQLVDSPKRVVSINAFHRNADSITLLGYGPGGDPGVEVRNRGRKELVKLADEGKISVRIEQAFPLEHVAAAHDLMASGHAHGKIVLIP
jgi:NADPH2:quinone reductase